jgi:Ran GTPase-activating protein (RanGAP) involved in mRNA processing and transport
MEVRMVSDRREGRQTVKPIAELRELTLTGEPDYEAFEWVAESPQLSTLRVLTVGGLWGDSLARLVASPHLAGLRALRLPSNNLGNPGLHALAESATLKALEELDFSSLSRHERYIHDPVIRAAGMGALMNWSGLATVRSLNLKGNDVSRDGLRALLRSPHAARLKELSVRDAQLDGAAMAEFASALPELRLETLDLGENVIKDVGAEYVATVPCLSELKALTLDRCEVSLTGARLFAKKATFLGGLRCLDVSDNYFGPTGLAGLLEREPPSLHTLEMRDNNLSDEGAAVLAGSPASDTLLEVDLARNNLGLAAARALSDSAHLRGLVILRLADNPINASSAAALAASLGKRLAVLELDNLPPAPSKGK